jgi:thioredoxin reductase (NADPH)
MLSGPKTGYEISMDFHRQAKDFGASFFSGSVSSIKKEGDFFTVGLFDGTERKAPSVIIATGSRPRPLDITGEKEFTGRGVSYCATCDGNFFKGKKMLVVGGGDAACDEARYLSRLTNQVMLIHRRDAFRAQKALVERTMNNPNIKVELNRIIREIKGEQKVKSVILEDTKTGKVYEEETDAVFIFAGTLPQSSVVSDSSLNAALDENGYIITDQKMATNIAGLYAAGDVRSGAFRQVITAAADGAVAAKNAAEYIDEVFSPGSSHLGGRKNH